MEHQLHEEVGFLLDDPSQWIAEDVPFGGKWKQPKKGPWISISIMGKHAGDNGSEFSGVFPLRPQHRLKVLSKGHKPWFKYAKKRWGEEPYQITAYWHDPSKGSSKGKVLWRWDQWDGFRDTSLLRGMQRQLKQEMNGDAVQHVVDMARKHGIKGEGPGGKFTPAQVRKLASMRESLDNEVDRLAAMDGDR